MFIEPIRPSGLARKITSFTTAIVFALSLFSLFGRYPYLELTTHFRLQYTWISFACIIALCIFRAWKIVPLAVSCALFNLFFIFPYYYPSPPHPKNDSSAADLRLMLANVQGNNTDYASLIEAVKSADPDVAVLQETTGKWLDNIQPLNADYPYSKFVPRGGGSGLAVLSRYPLESAEILTLDASTHPALFCRINLDSTTLSVFTMHPPTPMRRDKFDYRNGQFRQAAAILKTTPEPKLIIGDLNTTVWSPYFAELLKDSGLRDARLGNGLYPSWNAILPPFLGIPIDHCLISEKIEVERIATNGYFGSDHRPLLVNLRIEKQLDRTD